MNSSVLTHHGILGQKWGVRRTPAQLGRNKSSSGKKTASDDSHDDYKKAHSGKSVKTMSDAELRSKLNRLQMERQYSQQIYEGNILWCFSLWYRKRIALICAYKHKGLLIINFS